MSKVRYVFILLSFVLSACTSSTKVEDFADDSMEKAAKDYIDRLISGNYEAIISELDPKMRKENEMELLSRMGRFFPSRAPTSIDLVGYRLLRINNEPDQYNLTYQYGYGQKWLLVNVAFRDLSSEGKQIIAFNVSPIERSLQEIHKFSLQGKGSMHYSFLIICTTCPLFIFSTLIVCIKTKLKKRKWLWIPFVMLGMVQFSLNWTTGQFWIKLLSIQLLGTGAVSASIYSPWILSFSLPVGAIIFWIKRLKDRRTGVGEGRRGSEEDQSSVS